MKWLNNVLGRVGVDKALHFAFGAMIESWFCFVGGWAAVGCGFLLLLLASLAKEYLLDRDGKPDLLDVAAGMAGGLVEVFCWLLVVWLKF